MRKLLAAFLAAFSTLAAASSATTDFSDLWFNPGESGWGVNVSEQNNILFLTMFVYDTSSTPFWYVASDVELVSTSNGTLTFSGTLYRTSGPSFTLASFNPAQVGATPVGVITFSAASISNATLTYTIDGQTYTKNVQRQTWKYDDVSGTYLGGSTGVWSSCGSRNGPQSSYATYSVTHDGASSFQMREDVQSGGTCTYTGTYSQAGRMGSITGTGLCSDGVNQTFTASEVQVTLQGLTMRFQTGQVGGCVFTGQLGGLRVQQ